MKQKIDVLALISLGDDSRRYLQWIKEKHGQQNKAFAEKLTKACAAEFLTKDDRLTEDERAEIYTRVRQKLELKRPENIRLRKHLSIRCNS